MSGLFGGGADIPQGSAEADNVTKTAESTVQSSEVARKNRRLQASTLTKGFAPPQLGQSGLLGVS